MSCCGELSQRVLHASCSWILSCKCHFLLLRCCSGSGSLPMTSCNYPTSLQQTYGAQQRDTYAPFSPQALIDHGQGNPFMLHTHFKTSKFALGVLVSTTTDGQNRHASKASCVHLTSSAYAMLTVHCRLTSSAKLQTVSSSWTRSSKLPYLGPVKGATWLTWGSR